MEWIKCSDRMPEIIPGSSAMDIPSPYYCYWDRSLDVICFNSNDKDAVIFMAYRRDLGIKGEPVHWINHVGFDNSIPTHWMPLPATPKD